MTENFPAPVGGILAGGASRRFGRDKADAILAGRSLRDHVANNLDKAGCDLVLESNNAPGHDNAIPDRREDAGPLAGIDALLYRMRETGGTHLLTCPVDIPVLPEDFGPRMIAAARENPAKVHLARPANHDAWLCALWPVSCHDRLTAWLDSGERRVLPFLQSIAAISVPFPATPGLPAAFCNINRQSDLETVAKLVTDVRVTP